MNRLRIFFFAVLTAGIMQAPSRAEPLVPPPGAKPAAPDDGNLLVNTSFEDGLNGWELIAFHKKGTAAVDPAEIRNGKPTLRIENTEGDQTFLRQMVTGKPYTRYRLTGYIRTKNVQQTKPIEKSGAVLLVGMTLENTRPIPKTQAWTKVTLDFTTKNETEIRVGPSLGTYAAPMTGTAWFSEVKLIEVGGHRR